jgi:hypothetical protein
MSLNRRHWTRLDGSGWAPLKEIVPKFTEGTELSSDEFYKLKVYVYHYLNSAEFFFPKSIRDTMKRLETMGIDDFKMFLNKTIIEEYGIDIL